MNFNILRALVISVFFSGFINLVPTGNLSLATVIIDTCYVVLTISCGFVWFKCRREMRFDFWMIVFLIVLLVYAALFLSSPEPSIVKLLSWRSQVLYAAVAVVITIQIRSFREVEVLLRLVCWLGVGFAGFGVLQFLLRNVLPEWLLVSGDTHIFGYFGTDIVRSTGLLGNTIIYANIMLLVYSIVFCRLLFRFSWLGLMASVVTLSAVFCTFSRAAIAGAAIVSIGAAVVFAIHHRKRVKRRHVLLVAAAGAVTLGFVASNGFVRTKVMNSFLVRDLFLGQNASVQGSTAGHSDFWYRAFEVFHHANPWIGLGVGTQSQGSNYSQNHAVITDGIWISLFIEGGFVLLIAYVVFIATIFIAILRAWTIVPSAYKYLVPALGLFSLYEFALSAMVNSSFFGKNSFILFWVCFGLLMAVVQISKRARIADDPIGQASVLESPAVDVG